MSKLTPKFILKAMWESLCEAVSEEVKETKKNIAARQADPKAYEEKDEPVPLNFKMYVEYNDIHNPGHEFSHPHHPEYWGKDT